MVAPILFLTYRRFGTAEKVFESIRKAKPSKLYFASNGPIKNDVIDFKSVQKVRGLLDRVDWECEVHTRFLPENLSVKNSLNSSISWFFDNVDCGIIIEDDCLPHPDFYSFCSELLERYKDENTIWSIIGHNFQDGVIRGEGSYYFSRYNHVWGWASWRRAWRQNDLSMSFWPKWKKSVDWKNFWESRVARWYWTFILDRMHKDKINTWDYCWTANLWFNGGLAIVPNVNLVSNIGFGPDATHTTLLTAASNKKVYSLDTLRHPDKIYRDITADLYTFEHHYNGVDYKFPMIIYKFPYKVICYLYRELRKKIRLNFNEAFQ